MKISSPSDSQELTYTARAGLKSKVFLPNVIGPSLSVFRSGLAACAGATLLFTPGDKLVPPRFIGEVPNPVFEGINKLSLFFILSDHPEAARVIGLILCLASILGASSIGVAWIFYSLHNTAITPDGGGSDWLDREYLLLDPRFGKMDHQAIPDTSAWLPSSFLFIFTV